MKLFYYQINDISQKQYITAIGQTVHLNNIPFVSRMLSITFQFKGKFRKFFLGLIYILFCYLKLLLMLKIRAIFLPKTVNSKNRFKNTYHVILTHSLIRSESKKKLIIINLLLQLYIYCVPIVKK